ncbi:MAG: 3-hydroxyacyl-CoA dehydrogenase family protein, partial [Alphaproteobacteria bacterium]|nr:3-hydroxyacyl-CoA dehydrogenase family protein [Alphaproteobacteria bacterium]
MQSTEPGRRLDHVVVVGANGVMGYGAGALFARAGTKVTFLARSSAEAEEGLAAAIKQAGCETLPAFAETGSYMQDLETVVAGADLVIEALAEDFSLKDGMFARVAAARQENCIVGTVTSGLSINNLCANRDASFRRHFLGLHLFNPP